LLLHKRRIRSIQIIQTTLQGNPFTAQRLRSYFNIYSGLRDSQLSATSIITNKAPSRASRIPICNTISKCSSQHQPRSSPPRANPHTLPLHSRRRHTTSRHILSVGCTLVPCRIITKHTHPGLVFKSGPPARALPTHGPGSVRLVCLKTRRRQQRPCQVRSAIKKRWRAKTDGKAAPANSVSLRKRPVHGVPQLVCYALGAAVSGRSCDSRVYGRGRAFVYAVVWCTRQPHTTTRRDANTRKRVIARGCRLNEQRRSTGREEGLETRSDAHVNCASAEWRQSVYHV
jgi:hypothetical protein